MAAEALLRELEALLARQEDTIEDTFELLSELYGASVVESVQRIRDLLRDVDLDASGSFTPDTDAVVKARLELQKVPPGVTDLWRRWEARLDRIVDQNQQYMTVATGDEVKLSAPEKAIVNELKGQWPRRGEQGYGLAGRFYKMSEQHRQELADTLTRHVLGRGRPENLTREFAQRTGRARNQATQIVRDSTIQFSRAVNYESSKKDGFKYYEYFGPKDSITRPFCSPLLGRVFSEEEIDAMDNGQTGVGTVMIACGGFNCRHRWRAVDESWFSPEEWATKRAAAPDIPEALADKSALLDGMRAAKKNDKPITMQLEEVPGTNGRVYQVPKRMPDGTRSEGGKVEQKERELGDRLAQSLDQRVVLMDADAIDGFLEDGTPIQLKQLAGAPEVQTQRAVDNFNKALDGFKARDIKRAMVVVEAPVSNVADMEARFAREHLSPEELEYIRSVRIFCADGVTDIDFGRGEP